MDIGKTYPGLTLGDEIAQALEAAAVCKAAAFRSERLYKRTYAQVLLMITDAKTVAEREARTLVTQVVIRAEDDWISAQTAWNIAQAKADGLQVRFEEWRSRNATARAEMKL